MYSTPNSPTIKHCAQCGAEFEAHSVKRLYCAACIDQRHHPVIKRQCSICGADVEVILRSYKTSTDKSKRTICVACREAALVRKCRDCGVALVKPGVQRCAACWEKNRKAQKAKRSKPAAKSGICQRCGCDYTPAPNKKYCSFACRAAAWSEHIKRPKPKPKRCEQCGGEFAPDGRGRKQRYCSERCRHQANYAKGTSNEYTCKYCGKTYKAKRKERDQFCSRECARLFGHPERRKPKPEPKPMPMCAVCGKPCKSRVAKTCCISCRSAYISIKARERNETATAEGRSERPCKQCGAMFAPEYGSKRRSFCGDKCSKRWARKHREHNLNARARKLLRRVYGDAWPEHYESINKRKVFQRDGWRCQLCGCKIKRTKSYHPQQATVDHIVPLSVGGDHMYVNVQAACMACNSRKSGNAQGQMRLIG